VTLADGVLLAPLIGTIDSRRAQTLTERLLRDIATQRVQLLILDIAGVTLIDIAVAHTLIQITEAVRLLGCRVVLTGVAPTVALTLTHLGTDLGGMETARSPQEVLASRAVAGGPSAHKEARQVNGRAS
jgi:rsbT co-antagonist protein RsbR